MGHVGALCPDRPGFCPVFGIDQWFQWALHNRDIVSQNESLNPISGTDFRVKKKLPHGPGWRDFFRSRPSNSVDRPWKIMSPSDYASGHMGSDQ